MAARNFLPFTWATYFAPELILNSCMDVATSITELIFLVAYADRPLVAYTTVGCVYRPLVAYTALVAYILAHIQLELHAFGFHIRILEGFGVEPENFTAEPRLRDYVMAHLELVLGRLQRAWIVGEVVFLIDRNLV